MHRGFVRGEGSKMRQMKMRAVEQLRWGIVGLGNIAHQFVKDLQILDEHVVWAAASRSMAKAKAFAGQYGIENSYGEYASVFEDEEVDIVYIATPHDSHMDLSIQAMDAGKHVLCEKPLAVNGVQAQRMVDAARRNKVFLMEAFWTRFNPSIVEVLELLKNGEIGEVNYLNADFSFFRNDPDESRMLNMDLAGGSLLDMGVYPVFLAYAIFGKPLQVFATARTHHTGADLQTAAILKYDSAIANLMSGFKSESDMVAKIYGTEGSVFIDRVWHESQGYRVVKDGKVKQFSRPTLGKGFTYEIQECRNCIKNQKLESDLWSHRNSLDLVSITDQIRQQTGVIYPFENE